MFFFTPIARGDNYILVIVIIPDDSRFSNLRRSNEMISISEHFGLCRVDLWSLRLSRVDSPWMVVRATAGRSSRKQIFNIFFLKLYFSCIMPTSWKFSRKSAMNDRRWKLKGNDGSHCNRARKGKEEASSRDKGHWTFLHTLPGPFLSTSLAIKSGLKHPS